MQLFGTMRAMAVVAALLAAALAAPPRIAGQLPDGLTLASEPRDLQPLPGSASGEQIFAELVRHNEARSAALRQYSELRTYSVADLTGKVHVQETVRMEYVAPDKKTFIPVSEKGSGVVRHLVLNRLMESEISTSTGKEHNESAITPANYTFRPLGQENLGEYRCIVVEAVPRRKEKYLFEGKVWIDSSDYAVVKIAGHPAKKLSFWIKQADFVRQYQKVENFWLPARDETLVNVRFYGKKILRIEHHITSVNGETSIALGTWRPRS